MTRLKAASIGLKKGMENHIFWSGIGSGFLKHSHPNIGEYPPGDTFRSIPFNLS